jgi:hypothetical protein
VLGEYGDRVAKQLSKFTGLLTEKHWPTVPSPTCDTGNLALNAFAITFADRMLAAESR